MDDHIVELLRDRFDRLDAELSSLNTTLKEHTTLDALYWKKIDETEAQVSLLKWLSGSLLLSSLLAWFYSTFGKH